MKHAFVCTAILVLLHALPANPTAAESLQAQMYFDPSSGFLRVQAAMQVELEAEKLQFSLFRNVQITSIWIPGMRSYGVERRVDSTLVSVSLRTFPEEPQVLELSYEGVIDQQVLDYARLDSRSLWFPLIPVEFRLDHIILELPDKELDLEKPWKLEADGRYRFPFDGQDYPVIQWQRPDIAPMPPGAHIPAEPEPKPGVPDDRRVLALHSQMQRWEEAWEQRDSGTWQALLCSTLDRERTIAYLEDVQKRILWSEQTHEADERVYPGSWIIEWHEDGSAAARRSGRLQGQTVTFEIQWQFSNASWHIVRLHAAPKPDLEEGVMLDTMITWLDDFFETAFDRNGVPNVSDFFVYADQARQAQRFFCSLDDPDDWSLHSMSHDDQRIRLHAALTDAGHRFVLELTLVPIQHQWKAKSLKITPF